NPWSAGTTINKKLTCCMNDFAKNNGMVHLHSSGVIHRDLAARTCTCPLGAYCPGGGRVYPIARVCTCPAGYYTDRRCSCPAGWFADSSAGMSDTSGLV